MQIVAIPCLEDNYSYLVHDPHSQETIVVDPSEAEPILKALKTHQWKLTAIWNTHHHWDHVGGNLALKEMYSLPLFCSSYDLSRIASSDHGLDENSSLKLGPHTVQILQIPGHTLGHIAYYIPHASAVFTGDTLFSLGCGRLFEGTPEMMWQSLQKLAALPDETQIYCGHEYTLNNGRFAKKFSHDPGLLQYLVRCQSLRVQDRPTIPSKMGLEKQLNPFLNAVNLAEFTQRRLAKDQFR